MFRVHINNRRFFNDVIATIAGEGEERARKVSKIVDKKNKIPRENYEKEMGELGITAEQIAKIDSLYGMSVADACALCPESRGAQELASLFDMLTKMGLDRYCTFDFGIVRGLDYYTGTVFEVFDLAPENNRAMFGGGRYDNLVGLFVKNQISGVGYGLGDVTLENFLTIHHLIPDLYTGGTKVLVTVFDDVPYEHTACLVESLRDAGIASTLYIGKKKFGKQLDWGVKQGFSHVVIIGGSEYEAGEAKVKNLISREEQTVKMDDLIAFFA
jgi:histidyl-tRNA synthetase